jgi:hypothetical protein
MYVIGSMQAVTMSRGGRDGPAHWRQLKEYLEKPPDEGAHAEEIEEVRRVHADRDAELPASTLGVGSALHVTCPRHSGTTKEVFAAEHFPNAKNWHAFCKEPCKHELECGHACGLPCHTVAQQPHAKVCETLVVRPCEEHIDVPLKCCDVMEAAKQRPAPFSPLGARLQAEKARKHGALELARLLYKCEVPTRFVGPCAAFSRTHCCACSDMHAWVDVNTCFNLLFGAHIFAHHQSAMRLQCQRAH